MVRLPRARISSSTSRWCRRRRRRSSSAAGFASLERSARLFAAVALPTLAVILGRLRS